MSNILEMHKKVEEIKKYIKYVACYIRVSTDEQVKFRIFYSSTKRCFRKIL